MNLPKQLLCVLTFIVMLMVSCQKEQLENQTNAVAKQQSHSAIDAIIKRYSSSTSLSKTKFDEAVKLLDYYDVSIVLRPSLSPLLLIHLNKNDADGRKRYLAVSLPNSKSDNFYHFEGIYSSKELSYIKQAITTDCIEKDNIVTLRLLNEKLLKEWDATGTKTVARIAKSKSLLTPGQLALVKRGNQSVLPKNVIQSHTSSSVQEPKVNLVDAQTVCTEYYWVEYDPETGKIYSAQYLYKECIEYGGGGDVGSEEIPSYYSQTQILNEDEKIDDESEIGGNPGFGAVYPLVRFQWYSDVEYVVVAGISTISSVFLLDTKCLNWDSQYVDSYGNAGRRILSLSNHVNNWTWFVFSQLVKCHWKFDVLGTYNSPGLSFTKFWTRTKSITRG